MHTIGIDVNHTNRRGYTPLSIAAANGNLSLVTTLMYYGTVQYIANASWQYDCMLGGDPSIPNNDGTLPVQLAASFGRII